MSVEGLCADALGALRARGTYRTLRTLDGPQGPRTRIGGRELLLFAGSNYLDLASHPEVVEASVRAARSHGCAAGGSRLISGNLTLHERLEEELAEHLGTETALVFGTGYMANVGLIPALVGPGDAVVSDALNHASIIDGCRLSRAEIRVFPHGDPGAACCSWSMASTAWMATWRRCARWRLSHGAMTPCCCSTMLTVRARWASTAAGRRSCWARPAASTRSSARSARRWARSGRSWPGAVHCASCS
jgi:hypothetical protein